ncbi:xylulose kinase [Roseibium sp. TrichSKD4]|uniref:FGGY-family carbohydrate kinase n=1 Tax=Roseibium sp. TrichSKD4 TaxID=744980 RepID=UPI0001E56E80|nr:FGGY-family carbohydrate kinase [Roseibium sp. TrichSKD4]EFO32023.1 xylulose kinase [Roseibium sp. TrichSKD4]
MSHKDLLIGIDAGTSVIKAVAFDLTGREVAQAVRRNTYTSLPNGGVEQNMERTWSDTAAVLKELTEAIPNCANRCLSLAVTGQGDGTWLVDNNGTPIHDGWLWLDGRAADISKALQQGETGKRIYEVTATGINISQMRSHLCWMKAHAPDLLEKAGKALHCKDWLYLQLTGEFATDITEGLFTFGDFKTRTYSNKLLADLGLGEFKHILPPILDGTTTAHGLSAKAASQTGLPQGLPVSLGLVDVMCCGLGAGLYDPQNMPGLTILGSTGMHMRFVPSAENVTLNNDRCGYTMAFPGSAFAQMQTNMAATLNIDWVLGIAQQILASQGIERDQNDFLATLDDLVLSATAGKALFHPFISSAGERGPFTDPNARASWTGLDQTTTWPDLLRSVLDSLVLATRDCYQTMGTLPHEIRLTGGAAKSQALRKMLASALNAPVRTIAQPEAGAAGAAMMAAVKQGVFASIEDAAAKWVTPLLQEPVLPDTSLAKTYGTLFAAYLETRQALSPVWQLQAYARKELS